MKVLPFVLFLAAACGCGSSTTPESGIQEPPPALFESYETFKDSLLTLASIQDAAVRDTLLNEFWDTLSSEGQIPFVFGEKVAFLYRGTASSLRFVGDFNGWNTATRTASRLSPSPVWLQEETFPLDARLDYKIVRNANEWLLDPENPLRQRGGFGDNSVLRMPDYVPSPWVTRCDCVTPGMLSNPMSVTSTNLGQTIQYRVYLPAAYDTLDSLAVVYVTDGHEYADDLMGSMVLVLDNLIGEEEIPPVLAVFIDPRVNNQNQRGSQYQMNPQFADFVAEELVPLIDAEFKTTAERTHRAILGTSLGGLNSAYFGIEETDTFRLIAIQSPAFQAADGRIIPRYQNSPLLDLEIFMTWGTFFDFGSSSEQMLSILESKGYPLTTVVVNEGHSWGSWRALLDDILIGFWGEEATALAPEAAGVR